MRRSKANERQRKGKERRGKESKGQDGGKGLVLDGYQARWTIEDGLMDGWVVGWLDGYVDGWMDGWVEGVGSGHGVLIVVDGMEEGKQSKEPIARQAHSHHLISDSCQSRSRHSFS